MGMPTRSPRESFDVVVVGSGGGAMVGAYLAAKTGLSTVLIEKTSHIGGTSAYSGGACWLPGSDVQQRAGIADSIDSARTYLESVLASADTTKLDAFFNQSGKLVAELESDPAIEFEWIPFPEYFAAPGRVGFGRSIQPVELGRDSIPAEVAELVRPPLERDRAGKPGRRTLSGGQALIARLLTAFLREGGTVRTQHAVVDFVQEQNRIVAVSADTDAGPVHMAARRGVLLASGGFEGNAVRRTQYGVPGDTEWTMAPRGTNTGEPIDAAVTVGAATDLLDQGWFCPGVAQPDGRASFTLGFRGGIMVDGAGRRYANECLPYDRFGRAMAAEPGRIPSWLVFDSREGGRLPAIAMPEGAPAEHFAAGTWVCADTIAELAEHMRIPADSLTETLRRFNDFVSRGVDEDFHRGQDEYDEFFATGEHANKALVAIEKPPYYAAQFVLADLGTKGGLATDASARVLRTDASPIEGLYAVGNASASMTGAVYPAPGIPLGTAMVFASLAITDMVDAPTSG